MEPKVEQSNEGELPKVFTEAQEKRLREIIKEEIQRDHLEAFGDPDRLAI